MLFPNDVVDEVVRALDGADPHQLRPPPVAPDDMRELLGVGFYAGLQHEEGQPLRFRLALLAPDLDKQRGLADWWAGTKFQTSRAFTVGEVAKLAAATDFRQTALAVSRGPDGHMMIWGLFRVGTSLHRASLGERVTGQRSAENYVAVEFLAPGSYDVLAVDTLVLRVRGGELTTQPARVLEDQGPVHMFLVDCASHSRGPHLDVEDAYAFTVLNLERTLRLMLMRILDAAHGGTVVIIKNPADWRGFVQPMKYRADLPAADLMTWTKAVANAQRKVDIAYSTHRNAAEERRLVPWAVVRDLGQLDYAERLLDDAVAQAAKLAQVDGALVLGPDLRIHAFGAVLNHALLGDVQHAQDVAGEQTVPFDWSRRGTRHRSALGLCATRDDALAICISQDGGATACLAVGNAVKVWSPVGLEWRSTPRAGLISAVKSTVT
jgi:hypothetical protein